MSYKCDISGVKPLVGNLVSHANNKTKRRQKPNLVYKSFFVPQLNRKLKLRVASSLLRTIDKKGLEAVLKDYNKSWQDLI